MRRWILRPPSVRVCCNPSRPGRLSETACRSPTVATGDGRIARAREAVSAFIRGSSVAASPSRGRASRHACARECSGPAHGECGANGRRRLEHGGRAHRPRRRAGRPGQARRGTARRQHGRSGAVHAAWSSPHPTCHRCLRAKRINCGSSRVRPLSAGLLTPDAQGSANETIKTPTDIPQPVAMAVTIRPLGGSPGPTGNGGEASGQRASPRIRPRRRFAGSPGA